MGQNNSRRVSSSTSTLAPSKEWDKDFPAMTRDELLTKRKEFWETRVEGRAEMWQALQMSVEAADEGTKTVILESAGLTPLNIEKARSCCCYDERGVKYEIPMFVFHEPRNLITGPVPKPPEGVPDRGSSGGAGGAQDEKDSDVVKFRIRLSDGSDDMVIEAMLCEKVVQMKQIIAEHKKVEVERQRFIYQGRPLKDEQTLAQARIASGTVVQVVISKNGAAAA